jgi:hypothetical protein
MRFPLSDTIGLFAVRNMCFILMIQGQHIILSYSANVLSFMFYVSWYTIIWRNMRLLSISRVMKVQGILNFGNLYSCQLSKSKME